ncbi:nonribosomal peptide synthetase DhbF [Tahibacter aquaticus]|uniref:Nonribosomal peptide synthetase DhbF n=1 Tax=Tahibacter aquaticus TaxID=520092 RepID=A0A4R6YQV8_9GAMM|nr:non-ribosomal peptide synthetase [Tahibacter aquaticus]TDR40393.1 nonribosomal peptide synthetase DhbF [Tahibacter aquaticus]
MFSAAPASASLPLTGGQMGIWLGHEFAGSDTNFNLAEAVEIRGGIDVAQFLAAMADLVSEADTTRVRIAAGSDGPHQLIDPYFRGDLPYVDFSREADGRAAAEAWMRQDYLQRGDLAREALFRFALLRVGDDSYIWYHRCHHIVMDGFGGGLVARRLAELYSARVQQRAPDPASAFGSLASLVEEEAAYRESGRFPRDRHYWMSRFADTPAPASLAQRRLPNRGGLLRRTAFLAHTRVGELRRIAQELGATLPQLLIAATCAYLYRMTGADDLVVGVPVTARHNERMRRVPAMVANAVPLRLAVRAELPLAELVRETGRQMRQLLRHQAYRYEELRRDLGLLNSNQPLFTTVVNVEPFDYDFRYGDCPGTPRNLSNGTAEDLGIFFYDRGNGQDIQIDFDANPALYTEEALAGHQQRLQQLLDALIEDPHRCLGSIELLDAACRHQVVHDWNATAQPLARTTLAALLQVALRQHAARTALQFGDASLDYAHLDQHAEALAQQLRRRGVRRGSIVAVAIPRSFELVIALLASLRCGAAYLPLDSDYPRERLAFMLDDARPGLVLTTTVAAAALPDTAPLLLIDQPWQTDATDTAAATQQEATPADPAYVIYTSGTTGRPKGVVTAHAAIVNRLLWMQDALQLTPQDRILQKTPASFDVSVWEFFLPLLGGATLVLAQPGAHKDPAQIADVLARQQISIVHFVPSMLDAFLSQAALPQLPALRHVVCSGEALPPELLRRFRRRYSCALHNLYGPTEAAVDVSSWTAPQSDSLPIKGQASIGMAPASAPSVANTASTAQPSSHTAYDARRVETGQNLQLSATELHPLERNASAPASVPIGKPIWNIKLYILDAALQPLPPLARGDLYLAGLGLGEGYLDRPDLTAERFIANPFGPPGSRMYRSGDIASWNAQGEIEYHGRSDAQIKLRGLRIELAEIEAVLLRQAGVAQAAVDVRDQRLVAYLVASPGSDPVPASLREQLARTLPDYMLPASFVLLPRLPLSLSGKLDRAALPAAEARPAAPYAPPRTPTESALAELWAATFKLDRLGIHDNFFELGGHSLLIVQLLSKIRERFLVELPLDTLFQVSTIAELAERLDQAAPPRPPLRPQPRGERAPLSFAQARWWFLSHLAGAAPACNMPLALRLSGNLDKAALSAALHDLVQRHESLRTVYRLHEGRPWQQVLPLAAAPPRPIEAIASEDDIESRLQAAAEVGFDLAQEAPLRVHLFALDSDEHVLLLLLHHIAGDGASLLPLGRDLGLAYAARLRGTAPDWQPLPLQYADFAVWQERLLREDDEQHSMARQRAYWQQALHGLPEQIRLPWDRPRPAQASHRGGVAPLQISAEVHARLLQLARDTQASIFMLVQAALAALLTRLGAGSDIPLGCAVAGRHDHQLDDLIGCFVNTLVLRTDTAAVPGQCEPSLRELAARVRERNLGAYAHQDLPFDHLVELLQPQRSRASHPLFQVMLGFQNSQALEFDLPGLALTPQPVPRHSAKFDLAFILSETRSGDGLPGGIQGGIEYSADLFDAATATALARRFERWLELLSASPDESFAALPLLSADEHEWLAAHAQRPRALAWRSLADFVQQQAAQQPSLPALLWGSQQWSYAELNARANRLAHLLIGRGHGPGDVLAGVFDDARTRIVAQLAIAKCGAASLLLPPAQALLRLPQALAQLPIAAVLADTDLPAAAMPLPFIQLHAADTAATLAGQAAHDPRDGERRRPLQPQDLAYVIFTSGSSGTPKAVAVAHAGLASLATDLVEQLHLDTSARVLQYSSCAFDASVMDLLMAFAAGAALVLPVQERPLGDELAELLQQQRISHALIPPAALGTLPMRELPALRCLVVGGEACAPELVAQWSRGRRLINAYGPTEATICSSLSAPLSGNGRIDAGRPVSNTGLLILDEQLRLLPPGLCGELYIAGAGLASGYLGQPFLTAQRFIANPHGPAGSRLYRSGDLARWNAQGQLELLGRCDAQLKVRGYRIEPAEIEAALLLHAQVQQAAVVARADAAGSQRLIAYVLARPAVAPAVLRQHLAALLPDYMLPSVFMVLSSWPLGVGGKLDREQLPPPQFDADTAFAAAQTPLQQTLAALLASTLDLARVGLHDNFFDIGGHSLLALQLGQRIRAEIDAAFPLSGIYTHPSVAELARLIEVGSAEEVPQLDRDAQLPADIRWNGARPAPQPTCVLLTGATGFVGSHLLAALLRDTSAQVICTVRAADAAQARTRLLQSLALRRLDVDAAQARIDVIAADLDLPQLGLAPAQLARIEHDCDLLLHCAARVDFLKPYAALRAANVDSTLALIRCSQRGRPKHLHLVSTLAVIGPDNGAEVDEAAALASWHGLVDGYSQSKWVADSLARQAQRRGLPLSIYRLGAVTGDRRHAICNPADLIWRVTRLYADLGAIPALELPLNLTPADDVASAIVALATRAESWGQVYHLGSPQPLQASDIPAVFEQLGRTLQTLPLAHWLERARARLARTQDLELAAVLGILDRYDSVQRYPQVHAAATQLALQRAGAAIAPVDRALLRRYCENLGLGKGTSPALPA